MGHESRAACCPPCFFVGLLSDAPFGLGRDPVRAQNSALAASLHPLPFKEEVASRRAREDLSSPRPRSMFLEQTRGGIALLEDVVQGAQ